MSLLLTTASPSVSAAMTCSESMRWRRRDWSTDGDGKPLVPKGRPIAPSMLVSNTGRPRESTG